MSKSRLLLAISIIGIVSAIVSLNGCGKSSGSSTKFTIVGAGQ